MRRDELRYDLPAELIAQRPAEPRDASRLLVLDRATGRIEHRVFRDIGEYLRPGDCLVVNDTRVIPARFFCRRSTGGRIEGLFLREEDGLWRCLLRPSTRLKVGERLHCEDVEAEFVLADRHERGEWAVQPDPPANAIQLLSRIGQTPLPPYIRRDVPAGPDLNDAQRYQTVYATKPGAVAAPTAGLHFTPGLLAALEAGGVRRASVTLHVGLGTFAPIEVDDLRGHRMYSEWYAASAEAIATLRATRAAGGRIVAVGTTSARVLESLPPLSEPRAPLSGSSVPLLSSSAGSLSDSHQPGKTGPSSPDRPALLKSSGTPLLPATTPSESTTDSAFESDADARSGWTDVFIHPPYTFRNVDLLLTNFHLPESTLLALVMAFATPAAVRAAYAEAIARRYRFYSYGDAMLIWCA